MKRSLWMGTLFLAGAGVLTAQQASQDQFQGTSTPPPDDTITTYQEPPAKPAPGRPMATEEAQPAATEQPVAQPPVVSSAPVEAPQVTSESHQTDATDDGIVMLSSDGNKEPVLNQRVAADPDGDIVHPAALPPGTLGAGTTFRVRLHEQLSTAYSEEGQQFHATVASDVYQNNQVLIPAGSEIEGTVTRISTGHFAGHGSMMLRAQEVTLPNGSKYHMYAQVFGAPGTNTRVDGEGEINPGSQMKKDGILYGGGVGVGMIAGGAIAGPAGILAGTIVSAGAVTAHLLMDHPQATLDEGSVLLFSLTQPLQLAVENGSAPNGD